MKSELLELDCNSWNHLTVCKQKIAILEIINYMQTTICLQIIYIYICIYMCVCVCVCVYLGSSRSFKDVSLNNKYKFCLYNLFKILLSFLISFLVQVGIGRWISQNCPEFFRTLHRPSSGVACMCTVCLFFKKNYDSFKSLYHNKNMGSQSWIKQGN